MPIIEEFKAVQSMAQFNGSTSIFANLGQHQGMAAQIHGSTQVTANLANRISLSANFQSSTTIDCVLRKQGERNIDLSANIQSSTDFEATLRAKYGLYARFDGSTVISPNIIASEAEKDELNIHLEIYPSSSFLDNNQVLSGRLLINDEEVFITGLTINANRNQVGTEISIDLARTIDRALLVTSNIFKVQLGAAVSGVMTWYTVLDTGVLIKDSYSIGWNNNAPTDKVVFTTNQQLRDKLNKAPMRETVFYNSYYTTLNSDSYETVYDTEGRAYSVDLVPIAGMTLYSIFYNVFVLRCGFTSYQTNIEDFEVKNCTIDNGQRYLEGIGGLFGNFNPIIFEDSGILYILDATQLLPPGFPAPKQITTRRYSSVNITKDQQDVEGYIVTYSGTDKDWDFYVVTLKESTVPSGTFGDTNYLTHYVGTYTREYRRFSQPFVTVNSVIEKTIKRVRNSDDEIIFESRETFVFDYLGREVRRDKYVDQSIPWLKDNLTGEIIYSFQNVRFENDISEYAQDPYERDKQYRKTYTKTIRGLIYIDNSQYLNGQFQQEWLIAWGSGNLTRFDDVNKKFGPIWTRTETEYPQANGTCRLHEREFDHVNDLVLLDQEGEQVGATSINGSVPKQLKTIVYEYDGYVPQGKTLLSMSLNEIPFTIGKALVRRLLKSIRTKGHDLTMEYTGINLDIHRGTPICAIGRNVNGEDEVLGNFLVDAYSIVAKNLGQETQTINSTFQGKEI